MTTEPSKAASVPSLTPLLQRIQALETDLAETKQALASLVSHTIMGRAEHGGLWQKWFDRVKGLLG